MLLLSAFACTKSVDSYLFSRPTHPNNFKSTLDGELYAYTKIDSALSRADYYMRVQGYLVNYGEGRIVQYGHCWKKNEGANSTPNLSNEDLMTKFTDPIPAVGDSISFQSSLINLEPGTEYNVSSYVIIESEQDGKKVLTVGYNPDVAIIPTKPAIDEWFEQCADCPDGALQPSSTNRFDALGFSFGDTLFYGTGGQGYGSLNNKIIMYDPVTQSWGNEIQITFDTDYLPNSSVSFGMMDGIGCAIEYQRAGDPPGELTRSIFIGFADHGGQDKTGDKSNFLLEYALNKDEGWVVRGRNFANGRSGAVCFVLNGLLYFGTGSHFHNDAENNWFVYDPVVGTDRSITQNGNADFDGKGVSSLKVIPTNIKRKGAVSFVLNGKGYFGLGTDGKGKFYKDFWSFKPNREEPDYGTWERLQDFPGDVRANAVAFTIGDLGYVGAGDNLTATVPENIDMYFMENEGEWQGKIYNDFYRYNPYTNTWRKVQNYTANKGKNAEENRKDAIRPVTRAVAFASQKRKLGFVGYGLVPPGYEIPNPPKQQSGFPAQQDFWKYQPFDASAK